MPWATLRALCRCRAIASTRVEVAPLIEGLTVAALIADKAVDGDAIVAYLNERGAQLVISRRPRRKQPRDIDKEMCEWRHPIENFLCKRKEFKRIAPRADKTDGGFTAAIHLAAAVINSR